MVTQSKPKLVDLFPQDYAAIARIRQRLELSSDALSIRIALRELSRRLGEPESKAPAQEGNPNA